MSYSSFENNVTDKLFRLEIIFDIYIYGQDLALNNLRWLVCHKTKPTQPTQGSVLAILKSPDLDYCSFNIFLTVNLVHIPRFYLLLIMLRFFRM